MVKKLLILLFILTFTGLQTVLAIDAPVTTAGTVTSGTTTAVVPVTATNFVYIGSCMLEIHYDPAIAIATSVTLGPGMTGGLNTNLTTAGVIVIGWYTYPADTMAENSVIFNIAFSKVASGTTSLWWVDNGYSCYYSDGDYVILDDTPQENFYLAGSLTFGTPITADFVASNLTPPKNTTVTFTDLSTGNPTSWSWSFNRTSVVYVGGTDANSQNPQVQFTDGGLYTVTLVASNGGGSDTEVKTDYIRAGIHGLWTGVSSTAWMTSTNWDDWLVPYGTTDVVIPVSAAYWPVYPGDLTFNTACRSITMNGSSQATIAGSLTILSGTSLVVAGNGILRVEGNWTNAGTFTAGSGTVEFTGNAASEIIPAGSPVVINDFYNVTITKAGAQLTVPAGATVHVNGDLTIMP